MRKGEPAGGQSFGGRCLNGARLAGGGAISTHECRRLELRAHRARTRTLWDVAKVVALAALLVTLVTALWP